MDDKGRIKLRDYLATNYLQYVQGENNQFVSMNSLNERNYGVKKDIESLIRLIKIMYRRSQVKIFDSAKFEEFLKQLEYY